MAENGKAKDVLHLTLGTLSGVYIESDRVLKLTQIDMLGTYALLAKRLQTIAKNPDLLKELYDTLDRLHGHNRVLGLTTLIHPADHPLVIRDEWKERDRR